MPASTTFSVVGAGPLVARAMFDLNGDGLLGEAASTTSANGEFGQGVAVLQPSLNSSTPPAEPTVLLGASGIDATTGLIANGMSAPVGATVISPLSTLIVYLGDVTSVKAAFGLDSGSGALRPETELLRFNPALNWQNSDPAIARDAGRLTTINLQLLALATYLKVPLTDSSYRISSLITSGGTLSLTTTAGIEALLLVGNPDVDPSIPTAWRQAKAELIAKYMAAMPERITNAGDVRAWAYTFNFYILPELEILAQRWPNPAAGRIAAIQSADVVAVADSFRTSPAPVVGPLMAVPDYRVVNDTSSPPYSLDMTGCTGMSAYGQAPLPSCNDWLIFRGPDDMTLTSIQAVEPGNLTVNFLNGGVQFSRVGSFTGLTRVTYTARAPSGDTATGVVFVMVRESD